MMIQDHGSFSTFAMISTNNLLRKSVKDMIKRRNCLTNQSVSHDAASSGGLILQDRKSLIFHVRMSQQ
uniref:Ovule protein n=1 Tax=Caenorhabditis tropicalis TaxID=1561998 RepID=A0A1I7T6I3_9PELO